jgi:hypothetical protein
MTTHRTLGMVAVMMMSAVFLTGAFTYTSVKAEKVGVAAPGKSISGAGSPGKPGNSAGGTGGAGGTSTPGAPGISIGSPGTAGSPGAPGNSTSGVNGSHGTISNGPNGDVS